MSNELETHQEQQEEQKKVLATSTVEQQPAREFKYKIGFNQSVSTGVVALEGYVHFDDGDAGESTAYFLSAMANLARNLKEYGYTLAIDGAPKRLVGGKEVIKDKAPTPEAEIGIA